MGDPDTAVAFDGTTGVLTGNVPFNPNLTALVWAKSATANWNVNGFILSDRSPNGLIIHPLGGSRDVAGYVLDSGGSYHQIGGSYTPGDISAAWHLYGLSYDNTQ